MNFVSYKKKEKEEVMESKEEKEEEIQELIFLEFAIKRSKYECKVYLSRV